MPQPRKKPSLTFWQRSLYETYIILNIQGYKWAHIKCAILESDFFIQ